MKTSRIDLTHFEGHSPAPWEVDERFMPENPNYPQYRIFAANVVCKTVLPSGFYRSPKESCQNANLIAAAPALLAALREAYERIDRLEGGLKHAHSLVNQYRGHACETIMESIRLTLDAN